MWGSLAFPSITITTYFEENFPSTSSLTLSKPPAKTTFTTTDKELSIQMNKSKLI